MPMCSTQGASFNATFSDAPPANVFLGDTMEDDMEDEAALLCVEAVA
jgi:hypothetical protein